MYYTGTIAKEALTNEAVLNFVTVLATDTTGGAFVKFTVDADLVLAVADEISKSLKSRGFLAVIASEYEKYAIFPNKVFKYGIKDEITRKKAIDYAATLEIGKEQCDAL